MASRGARFLLAFASLLSAVGGTMHVLAFRKAATAIAASNLAYFYAASSKGLWLADSATLFILAIIFGLLAARPSTTTGVVVMLVALIPAATAILLYTFLGNFFAGHVLVAISALSLIAALRLTKSTSNQPSSLSS